MNSANSIKTVGSERLADAFQLFNQLSRNLTDSYQGLEAQVARLNQELARARDERVSTLIEKERLATRLQQILSALPAAVVVLDEAEQVIDCNSFAVEILGQSLLGQSWNTVMQRSLFAVADSPHERLLGDGRRVSIKCSNLDNEAGQIVMLSDVTELRALQEVLTQQKHLSAMGEMVAAMAHQVRTPLSTAILYASQMNKPTVTDDKRQVFARKILERLHHLERQVNDMLIFAKQGRLSMETFSLSHLMVRIAENMSETGAEFYLHNQLDADLVLGNEDALRGALMNILNNAVEASGSDGRIELIITRHDENSFRIVISDNGEGMTELQQKRLFEPFFTTKLNGTGLGLAVVESVIGAHSGTVKCHSVPGRGTEFSLILPCIHEFSLSLSAAGQQEVSHYANV
jgi:two-component system, sensor histidine kinase FlrB